MESTMEIPVSDSVDTDKDKTKPQQPEVLYPVYNYNYLSKCNPVKWYEAMPSDVGYTDYPASISVNENCTINGTSEYVNLVSQVIGDIPSTCIEIEVSSRYNCMHYDECSESNSYIICDRYMYEYNTDNCSIYTGKSIHGRDEIEPTVAKGTESVTYTDYIVEDNLIKDVICTVTIDKTYSYKLATNEGVEYCCCRYTYSNLKDCKYISDAKTCIDNLKNEYNSVKCLPSNINNVIINNVNENSLVPYNDSEYYAYVIKCNLEIRELITKDKNGNSMTHCYAVLVPVRYDWQISMDLPTIYCYDPFNGNKYIGTGDLSKDSINYTLVNPGTIEEGKSYYFNTESDEWMETPVSTPTYYAVYVAQRDSTNTDNEFTGHLIGIVCCSNWDSDKYDSTTCRAYTSQPLPSKSVSIAEFDYYKLSGTVKDDGAFESAIWSVECKKSP